MAETLGELATVKQASRPRPLSVLFGLGLGAIVGTLLGLAMGYVPVIDAVSAPFIEFLRPLPQLADLVLLIIWFGIDRRARLKRIVVIGR